MLLPLVSQHFPNDIYLFSKIYSTEMSTHIEDNEKDSTAVVLLNDDSDEQAGTIVSYKYVNDHYIPNFRIFIHILRYR